jgi:hypothetical protein
LNHFVWENESVSDSVVKSFIDIAINKIDKTETEKFKFVFQSINIVLLLEDSLQKKRIKVKNHLQTIIILQMFMTSLIDYLVAKKDTRPFECKELVRCLQIINESNKEISKWLTKNENKWQWIPKWYTKIKADIDAGKIKM